MPRRTQALHERPSGFVYGTVTRCGLPFQIRSTTAWLCHSLGVKAYNPETVQTSVWAFPRSLATTEGILSFPEAT